MPTSPRLFALMFAAVAALATPVAAGVPIIGPDGQVPSLAPLLRAVTPSVVNIAVMGKKSDDPQVAGSGVIVDAKGGFVLTNHHVIEHADRIVVTLKDDRRFDAKLVGSDPDTDIAVLKISAQNLTAMPIGDADRLEVGDYVLAIGNPFGLGQAVTSGIVSALGRTGLGLESYENFIQTDASINPGNSGGPLVNLRGEIIGINTAIVATGQGIGFAIPANMVKRVTGQLIDRGKVTRGWIGIATEPLTLELAQSLHIDALQLTVALAPGVDRGVRNPMLLSHVRHRSGISLAQDLHHLFFAKSGLLHDSLACPWEPSSQESVGPKIDQQVTPTCLRSCVSVSRCTSVASSCLAGSWTRIIRSQISALTRFAEFA